MGDPLKALDKYLAWLTIREELRRRAPDSAEFARDVWVSCWKMAHINESIGNLDKANEWWKKTYKLLKNLKLSGVFISTEDEGSLEQLRIKVESINKL